MFYCLFAGLVHATDYSNASATAIFDSYQVSYSCSISIFVQLLLSDHYLWFVDLSTNTHALRDRQIDS